MALKHFASQVEEKKASIIAQKGFADGTSVTSQKPVLKAVQKTTTPSETNKNSKSAIAPPETKIKETAAQTQIDNTINPALSDIPLTWSDQQMLCALSAMQIRYGRPAEAIPYLMMIRKINPSNIEATRLLSLSFMRMGRWHEAEAMIEELDFLQQSSSGGTVNGLVLLYRSLVSYKINKIADAKAWFGKFRKFNKAS